MAFEYKVNAVTDELLDDNTNRVPLNNERHSVYVDDNKYDMQEGEGNDLPNDLAGFERYVATNSVFKENFFNIKSGLIPYEYVIDSLLNDESSLKAVALSLNDRVAIDKINKKAEETKEAIMLLRKVYPLLIIENDSH